MAYSMLENTWKCSELKLSPSTGDLNIYISLSQIRSSQTSETNGEPSINLLEPRLSLPKNDKPGRSNLCVLQSVNAQQHCE